MLRNCVVFSFLLFAAAPGFADVVFLSVSEQIQGSGNAIICPFGAFDTCFSDSFNFADSNNQPGPYRAFNSGQAAVSLADGSGRNITAGTVVSQSSDVNTGNVSVNMGVQSSIGGESNHVSAGVSSNSQFLLLFSLSSPALVHLNGSVAGGIIDSVFSSVDADAHIQLSGPGVQFDVEGCPSGFCLTNVPFDELFILDVGTYMLSAFTDVNIVAPNPFAGTILTTTALSLSAEITEVPEPRWLGFFTALVAAIGCGVPRRGCPTS